MKHRRTEFLLILVLIAFVVSVGWGKLKQNEQRPARVTEQSSEITELVGVSETAESEVPRLQVSLKPKLGREWSLIHKDTLSVNGVRISMSAEDVRAVLGEPDRVEDEYPPGVTLTYSEPYCEIRIYEDQVVDVTGESLEHGDHSFEMHAPLLSVQGYFGANDFHHAYGAGGSKVYCWRGKTVVLEVHSHGLDEDELGPYILGDPTFFSDKPHLWYASSCGAVVEPTPEPRSVERAHM